MSRPKIPKFVDNIRQFPVVMTTGQVAAYLQLSNPTVANLAQDGKLPGKKIGDQWRFVRDNVQKYMEGTT